MSHTLTTVDLPAEGVVVVTGPNGAGKSALPEGVAQAVWGKSLRGDSPWRAGEAGRAEVDATRFFARRERSKSDGKKLSWGFSGDEAVGRAVVLYDTQTKAQEALDRVAGSFERWRRTHVFSSSDASHFTLATDAERKELLEGVLRLDRFDEGYARAQAARRQMESSARASEDAEVALRGRLGHAKTRLSALKSAPVEPEPKPPASLAAHDRDALGRAREARERLEKMAREARQEERALAARPAWQGDVARLRAEARHARAHAEAMASGRCGACGRDVRPDEARAGREEAERLEALLAAEQAAAEKKLREREGDLAELRQEADALAARLREAETLEQDLVRAMLADEEHQKLWRGWADRKARLQSSILAAEAEAVSLDSEVYAAHEMSVGTKQAVLEHLAAEAALGPKGVRADLLGAALAGVEAVANAWLGRVSREPMACRLTPYSATKAGELRPSIGLEFEMARGRRGYRALSGGERRRADAALLLALAQVASASTGEEPGTLWLDEVFDALDAGAAESLGEAVGDLARGRCVVLISHREDLLARVPAVMRLRVDGGVVRR